jgi:hypothetical protein
MELTPPARITGGHLIVRGPKKQEGSVKNSAASVDMSTDNLSVFQTNQDSQNHVISIQSHRWLFGLLDLWHYECSYAMKENNDA